MVKCLRKPLQRGMGLVEPLPGRLLKGHSAYKEVRWALKKGQSNSDYHVRHLHLPPLQDQEWVIWWMGEGEGTPKETKASSNVPAYKPTPLLQHPPAKPSVVKSSAIMVSSLEQPIASVLETPVVARPVTPRPQLHSVTPMPASCPTTPLITQSPPFAPDYDAELEAAYEALEQLKIIKINLMPDACLAILKEGVQFFQVKISNDVFTSPKYHPSPS